MARPRWRGLYAAAALPALGLALVDVFSVAPWVTVALRWGMLVGGFGAMAWWVRANAAALDRIQWCACAPRSLTVRVIASRSMAPPTKRGRRPAIQAPPGRRDRQSAGR